MVKLIEIWENILEFMTKTQLVILDQNLNTLLYSPIHTKKKPQNSMETKIKATFTISVKYFIPNELICLSHKYPIFWFL